MAIAVSLGSYALADTYIPGTSTDGVPGEFGSKNTTFTLNGSTYTNYQRGCTVVNSNGGWRDYGGANFDSTGKLSTTLNNAGESMKNDIIGNNFNDSNLNTFFGTNRSTYSDSYLKAKFQDAYEDLIQAGKAGGVPYESADVWNGVVQCRLRFGDSTANIDDYHRSYMTDLILSADKSKVYAVRDEFLQVYDPTRLGAPISNAGYYKINGKTMHAQLFANGYIVSDPNRTMTVNLLNNGNTILSYTVPMADLIDNATFSAVSGQNNAYTTVATAPSDITTVVKFDTNSGETYGSLSSSIQAIASESQIVSACRAEYNNNISSGFSMGEPSGSQYIHWWGGPNIFAQEFSYTSDPGDGFGGRDDTAIAYCPDTGAAYSIHGAILSAYTDGGKGNTMGYPLGEQKIDPVSGTVYQDFKGGRIAISSYGTVGSSLDNQGNLTVNVQNPDAALTYQIWLYTKIPSDLTADNENADLYSWVLEKAASDSATSVTVSESNAVPDANGNYKVMVIGFDGAGNQASESFDTAEMTTGAGVNIQKILLNGKPTDGQETINSKDTSSKSVALQIVGQNVKSSGGYSLSYCVQGKTDSTQLMVSDAGLTTVDFSGFTPGVYTFTATAEGIDGVSVKKMFTVSVYSVGVAVPYAQIGNMAADFGGTNTLTLSMNGTLTPPSGGSYYYNILAGEPGRQLSSIGQYTNLADNTAVTKTFNAYGTYEIYGTVGRGFGTDDGVVRYSTYARKNGNFRFSALTVSDGTTQSNVNGQTIDGAINKTFTIGATAQANLSNGEGMQYSFWRNDARGWVLLKDWAPSASASLSWTPVYAGNYEIQVRAKGSTAGSYEIAKTIDFNITGSQTASGTLVLNAISGAVAHIPVTLSATVQNPSSSDHLLYRFDIYDSNMGKQLLSAYSPNSTCTWIPRKAGSYVITAKVINQNSFGAYDLSASQTAVVGSGS